MEATVTFNEVWMEHTHDAYQELLDAKDKWLDIKEDTFDMIPKKQWTKGWLSIISPCWVTFWKYELFDWNETPRFDTLEEAQAYWDNLLSKK